MMPTVVRKYGGSSLATTAQIHRIAASVARVHRSGSAVVVVVSARGATTDGLLDEAGAIAPGSSGRELDQLLATGEQASAALLAMALERHGTPATSLAGPQTGIRATGRHTAGVISELDVRRIAEVLRSGRVVIVTGFQGVNSDGDLITLGRGGSDTTAVALAIGMRADHCEIYTDVDGICTADPRLVPDARTIDHIGFPVMTEMAFSGARVLHSRSIELAAVHGMEVHVGSSFREVTGTVISEHGTAVDERLSTVRAITHDLDVARLRIRLRGPDAATRMLAEMADRTVPIHLLGHLDTTGGGRCLDLTVRRADAARVRDIAARERADVDTDAGIGSVSVVGVGLLSRPEHLARMLRTLSGSGVPVGGVATSQLRCSVTVPADRVADAVRLLHREFALAVADDDPTDRRPDEQAAALSTT